MTDNKSTPEHSESTEPAISYSTCYDQCFSDVYLEDCIQGMKRYPDKYFDLAVVDPPYGIDFGGGHSVKNLKSRPKYKGVKHIKKNWDNEIPSKEYFDELFRVSKNQIVWGGNYMTNFLYPTNSWLIWDKKMSHNLNFSHVEMAWCSVKGIARLYSYSACGNSKDKIHPTQKNIKLYDWIFKFYAKEGDKILDTHLGSGSSRISANKNKLNFVGFEIDKEYFDKSQKRYNDFISQTRLF